VPADRPVCGLLDDGTASFAPIGEVVADGALVMCHLCGRRFRSVTARLPRHRWSKEHYCLAFGLERGQSLEGPETRKLRARGVHRAPAVRARGPRGQRDGPRPAPAPARWPGTRRTPRAAGRSPSSAGGS